MSDTDALFDYPRLLTQIRDEVSQAQAKAGQVVNYHLTILYWRIGQIIISEQQKQGWGARVIPRLAVDLKNEFPELKGFSERNIARMTAFCREYPFLPPMGAKSGALDTGTTIMPPAGSQLQLAELVFSIPWRHNILLIEKIKDLNERTWYLQQTITCGWGLDTLAQVS